MKHAVARVVVWVGAVALALALSSAQAKGPPFYTITDLGEFGRAPSTSFDHINNSGQLAGTKSRIAFIWDKLNGLQELGLLPGGTRSSASGLNNEGQVSGSTEPDGRAFRWDSATGMLDLGATPGLLKSRSLGINDSGQVVGESRGIANGSIEFLFGLPESIVIGAGETGLAVNARIINNGASDISFSAGGPTGLPFSAFPGGRDFDAFDVIFPYPFVLPGETVDSVYIVFNDIATIPRGTEVTFYLQVRGGALSSDTSYVNFSPYSGFVHPTDTAGLEKVPRIKATFGAESFVSPNLVFWQSSTQPGFNPDNLGTHTSDAFVWDPNGGMEVLAALPGHLRNTAMAINNFGDVVGTSTLLNPEPRTDDDTVGLLWLANGDMQEITVPPGYRMDTLTDISERRQVVGHVREEPRHGNEHAFVWSPKLGMVIIDTPADWGPRQTAQSINNRGQVLGMPRNPNPWRPAWLWRKGVLTDLNDLIPSDSGWHLWQARDINETGQIVGDGWFTASDGSTTTRNFLMTPGRSR